MIGSQQTFYGLAARKKPRMDGDTNGFIVCTVYWLPYPATHYRLSTKKIDYSGKKVVFR